VLESGIRARADCLVVAHDGYEWLSVLSGRMRLILGEEDNVLGVGEAVEFGTTQRRWFGSTGDGPAEVLNLFGRPGERIHVRTSSHREWPPLAHPTHSHGWWASLRPYRSSKAATPSSTTSSPESNSCP
jgi:hypothetical protein